MFSMMVVSMLVAPWGMKQIVCGLSMLAHWLPVSIQAPSCFTEKNQHILRTRVVSPITLLYQWGHLYLNLAGLCMI
jgi:hypothetical protein